MGSRSALKMTGSLSRATICSSRKRHAVIELPKAKIGKMLVWKQVKENYSKIQSKDEVEKECVPTPHCQSIITSFLSVRVARRMEKKQDASHRHLAKVPHHCVWPGSSHQ
jgi:hypothetical protein